MLRNWLGSATMGGQPSRSERVAVGVQRRVVVPLVTVGALAFAGGGYVAAAAMTGIGLFHATVAPAATSGTLTPSPSTTATVAPVSDTPAATPSAAPVVQDTQAVTSPTSSDPAATTTTAAPAATTTAAPAITSPAATSPAEMTAPRMPAPQNPATTTRPPAPTCPTGKQATWMGDYWVCVG